MDEDKTRRKLAAILSADVVGYSKLMADDEAATVETISKYRAAFEDIASRHEGRVVDAPGDNILCEFVSAVEAVHAAVEIQSDIETLNADLPEHRRMHFRIGLNLGDVIEKQDGTIYGDGVNIAARVESLADTGGICVSSTIFDAVRGKVDFGFDFLGERSVKNIEEPVRVYRVAAKPGETGKKNADGANRKLKFAGAFVLVLVAAGILITEMFRMDEPDVEPYADGSKFVLPPGQSVAVLPFGNMSDDPGQDYFSDGLTEDIITRLSRYPGVYVIARNSTNKYKDTAVDIRGVGNELGVRYVAQGSVRKAGDKVRVTVQLIDTEDGSHVFAETYDRDLTTAELFQIQDEITTRIAEAIAGGKGALVQTEGLALQHVPTENLDSYECVLRSYVYYDSITPHEHAQIRDCLERAVEEDPGYADAWAMLSTIYADEFRFGFNARADSLARALDAAQRSVRLDPHGFGQMVLADAHSHLQELDEFNTAADRAIAIHPNNASVLASMASTLFWSGQTERGYALMNKALALNPNHRGWWNFVPMGHHYLNKDYEAALAFALKVQMPGFFWTHAHLTAIYGQLGRQDEANASVEKLLALYPDFEEHYFALAAAFNNSDQIVDAYVDGFRKAGLNIPDRPDDL